MMPQRSGFASSKARGGWEQVVFSLDWRKDSNKIAGENDKVYVEIHRLFFSVHEIDHPSNISMNRTVEQLTENSGERKEQFNY